MAEARNRFSRVFFTQRLLRVYTHPLYAAVTALLSVMAGATVSLYATEIKASFPLCPSCLGGPVSWFAVAFWVSVLAAFVLVFFRQHAIDIRNAESFQQLAKLNNDSAQLLATMPPPHFLARFRGAWENAEVAARTCLRDNSATREQLETAMRLVLQAVLDLAQTFDQAAPDVVYGASVMLYRSVAALGDAEIEEVRGRLRFVEEEIDVTKLKGILDLDVALSTTSDSNPFGAPDRGLTAFALPVPRKHESSDGKLRILPGAPYAAFVSADKMDAYEDTATLLEFLDKRCALHPEVRQDVARYFQEEVQDVVRSFVSMGMWIYDDPEPKGVLNIHSSAEGLLAGRKRASMFVPLMEPFLGILTALLEQWRDRTP